MDPYRAQMTSQQAYIKKVLQAQHPSHEVSGGLGQLMRDTGGVGLDLLRHGIVLIGVVGLVAIAAGATTDCKIYTDALNYVSSFFVR